MSPIRQAQIDDAQAIHDLIYELAVFEKAPEQMVNTVDDIVRDGFGVSPVFVCFVAEEDDQVVGMSLCYIRYSTWKGQCLYLEDLVVKEAYRGRGIGKALFKYTMDYAKAKGFSRVQWQVLDWNQSAIDFYKSFNAGFDEEWLNAWVEIH
jgi:ribosomal protein S18 acetylase RimI-like enzyme